MCLLLGRPWRVAGTAATLTMPYEVPDTETLICEFESGVQMVCETCWNIPQAVDEFEVRGTDGTLLATPFDGSTLVLDRYGERECFDTCERSGIRPCRGLRRLFGVRSGFSVRWSAHHRHHRHAAYRSAHRSREETALQASRT